jgi:hypothetical protein
MKQVKTLYELLRPYSELFAGRTTSVSDLCPGTSAS